MYFIDVKEYEGGQTGRDIIRDTIYEWLMGEEK